MADYINSNILCQAYVHIESMELDKSEYEVFQSQIDHFIKTRGRFFLYSEVDPDVVLEDGSLKVYASLAGALYLAVGQHGDFRSGLDYLATDVKRLSESIVNECLFLSKSRRSDVIRVEARAGVVGSLKKIVDDLEYVKNRMGQIDVNKLAEKLSRAKDNTSRLLGLLKDPRDIPFVSTNLQTIARKCVPITPRTPPRKKPDLESNVIYRDERKNLLDIL